MGLLDIFSNSPFEILSNHMEKSCKTSQLLPYFFEKVLQEDWEQAKKIKNEITNLETQADTLKKEVRLKLYNNLFLPVSRYDLLSLVKSQDSIANQTEDIAGIVYGRNMKFPKSMHSQLSKYIDSAITTCNQANEVVNKLEKTLQKGFGKKSIEKLEVMIVQLDNTENLNDKQQIDIRKTVWKQEKNLDPIDVMFIYNILERIGNLADCAHHVGAQLMLLAAGN